MKKNTAHQDLSQLSLLGKPGFDLFQSEKNGQYYFHFNDAKGVPLLYSEAYTTSEGRDNGARSVLANSADEKRYTVKKEKNGVFFVLKAKNYKEIARSKVFTKEISAEKAMMYIQNNLPKEKISFPPATRKTKKIKAAVPKKTKPKRPPDQAKKVALPPLSAPKYFFKIDLYPHQEDNKISGKIYSAINEESLNFKGLDMDAIANFIKSQLPPAMVKVGTKAPLTTTQKQKTISKEMTEQALPEKKLKEKDPLKEKVKGKMIEENLQVQIRREGRQDTTSNLPVNLPLTLQLEPKEGIKKRLPNGMKIPIELKLKSLTDRNVRSMGEFMLTIDDTSETALQLPFYIPYPGVFRLIAQSKPANKFHLEGSVLVAGV